MSRQRIIFEGDCENMVLAGRAVRWMAARPKQKDAILAYGEGKQEVVMYVKRNKASILVYQDTRSAAPLSQEQRP